MNAMIQLVCFRCVIWGALIGDKQVFRISVNTLRPRQDGRHFPDDLFKCIFLNENVWISLKVWLKFPINNVPALVQIMAWRRSGDKPLSEPMMISLLRHICVTRPQWVNKYWFLSPWRASRKMPRNLIVIRPKHEYKWLMLMRSDREYIILCSYIIYM